MQLNVSSDAVFSACFIRLGQNNSRYDVSFDYLSPRDWVAKSLSISLAARASNFFIGWAYRICLCLGRLSNKTPNNKQRATIQTNYTTAKNPINLIIKSSNILPCKCEKPSRLQPHQRQKKNYGGRQEIRCTRDIYC